MILYMQMTPISTMGEFGYKKFNVKYRNSFKTHWGFFDRFYNLQIGCNSYTVRQFELFGEDRQVQEFDPCQPIKRLEAP